MKKIAKSTKSQNSNVLMFGKTNKSIKKLEQILAGHFNNVYMITDPASLMNLPLDVNFYIIVVTDSIEYPLNKGFFSYLKEFYPDAVLVCIVDQITQEMEIVMRSSGLLFLGSYDHFSRCYKDIFQSATKKNKPDKTNI